jgi:serpin B
MKITVGFVIIALAVFFSCQSNNPVLEEETIKIPDTQLPEDTTSTAPSGIRQDIPLTKNEQGIVQGNNAFAFQLLQTVARNGKEGENILVSPLSASLALAMLSNGAGGVTQGEIQAALGYGDGTRDDMNGYFRKMITAMRELDADVSFESANSIWIARGFPVLLPFKEVNQTYYEAEIRNEDFNKATLDLINAWCAEKTHGNIPEILKAIDPGSALYLLNALFFKGAWATPFDRELTKEVPFHNQDGATPNVPMMDYGLVANLIYSKEESFELTELPYGNGAFSMVFLLPQEGVSPASVIDNLSAPVWESCLSKSYLSRVKIRLPRFKVAYERALKDDLMALGMESMFNEHADFSLVSQIPLVVSSVLQKTTLEVNEEGAEASAATVIQMITTSDGGFSVDPVQTIKIDRPFIYLIKENSTGSIFFAGVIRNL